MKCPRCLNEDKSYFAKGHKGWYCRKCISFGRVMLEESNAPVSLHEIKDEAEEYSLKYPLTPRQKEISDACRKEAWHGDVLLRCVCGAGKTEMVVGVAADFLKAGKKVCFAIARRQVVLELGARLQEYFPYADVATVCGGHTDHLDGDLIVCTTHQLYRYYGAFDLLILDEPDAFPFRGSDVLHGIAKTACRGHTVYLTATPDAELLKAVETGKMKELVLSQRPHGKPIPVPSVKVGPMFLCLSWLIDWLGKHDAHPRMVFVPTIAMAKYLQIFISLFMPCHACTSKTEDRDEVIARFRQEENGVIVATTVLERGVTIPRADICVYMADHGVFDEAGLIQMAGRAGRSFEHPTGDVVFLCGSRSRLVEKCVKTLQEANACVA